VSASRVTLAWDVGNADPAGGVRDDPQVLDQAAREGE
jgi:hypothetical protein